MGLTVGMKRLRRLSDTLQNEKCPGPGKWGEGKGKSYSRVLNLSDWKFGEMEIKKSEELIAVTQNDKIHSEPVEFLVSESVRELTRRMGLEFMNLGTLV